MTTYIPAMWKGFAAFKMGKPMEDNPFNHQTSFGDWAAWICGWRHAEDGLVPENDWVRICQEVDEAKGLEGKP